MKQFITNVVRFIIALFTQFIVINLKDVRLFGRVFVWGDHKVLSVKGKIEDKRILFKHVDDGQYHTVDASYGDEHRIVFRIDTDKEQLLDAQIKLTIEGEMLLETIEYLPDDDYYTIFARYGDRVVDSATDGRSWMYIDIEGKRIGIEPTIDGGFRLYKSSTFDSEFGREVLCTIWGNMDEVDILDRLVKLYQDLRPKLVAHFRPAVEDKAQAE